MHAADAAKAPAPIFDLAKPALPNLEGVAEVRIHERGIALGSAPISWGGLPWDSNLFVETVVERFADLALTADARSVSAGCGPDASSDGVIVPALR